MTDRASAEGLRALDATKRDLLADVLRRCMGIDSGDNARHDFGDMNGGALQRPTEVATELMRALSDEGLTIAPLRDHSDSRDIDVERLAAVLTRSIAFPDDGTLARQEAERIAREYARASTPETPE